MALNEVCGLDEHAARATRRVENPTMVGFEDLDDQLHDRGWREKLTTLGALGEGELTEEVLVDEPEPVALDRLRQLPQHPEEFDQDLAFDGRVVMRKYAVEPRIVRLDGFHGVVDGLAEIGSFWELDEVFESGFVR